MKWNDKMLAKLLLAHRILRIHGFMSEGEARKVSDRIVKSAERAGFSIVRGDDGLSRKLVPGGEPLK